MLEKTLVNIKVKVKIKIVLALIWDAQQIHIFVTEKVGVKRYLMSQYFKLSAFMWGFFNCRFTH